MGTRLRTRHGRFHEQSEYPGTVESLFLESMCDYKQSNISCLLLQKYQGLEPKLVDT